MKMRPKILFVFRLETDYVKTWSDGLYVALNLLRKDFEIEMWNIYEKGPVPSDTPCDIVLGWGSLISEVARQVIGFSQPKGLLVGGHHVDPFLRSLFDVLFYETEWFAAQELSNVKNKYHAFGVNTKIFKPVVAPKAIDYLSIGTLAAWKRHEALCSFPGVKLVIGNIQKQDATARNESSQIIFNLLTNGVGFLPMITPLELVNFINATKQVVIPAAIEGGGERSVLEARACGVSVMVNESNPKLQELLTSPIWDAAYYAKQLRRGIESIL